MIKFSKEKVLLLHQLMAEATGGDVGIRDEALLESAIENIYELLTVLNCIPVRKKRQPDLDSRLFPITHL